MTGSPLGDILVGLIVGLIAAFLFYLGFQHRLPAAYTVAVVGRSRSGKTTLITSLFGEIFASKIPGLRAVLRGVSTIERVNQNISLLQKGLALGPTHDQDRFAYRTDVTVGHWIFKKTYKVEVGDFPGHYTEELLANHQVALNANNEFFKWIAEANAFIFVVDLGRYLTDSTGDFISNVSAEVRYIWQRVLDVNESRERIIRGRPMVLAFNKADLAGAAQGARNVDRLEELIRELGFGSKVPPLQEVDEEVLMRLRSRVENDFGELISYLSKETKNFGVIFVSSFGMLEGRRLGISQLFKRVLPQS